MNDRLLVDECLTPELVQIAHDLGFDAHHVAHIGLSGKPDRIIFERVVEDGLLFVTNNREDFNALVSRVDLHAGLIVILPRCRREVQKVLFRTALVHVNEIGGILNKVLEIDENANIDVFELPTPVKCKPVDEAVDLLLSEPAFSRKPKHGIKAPATPVIFKPR